MLTTLHSAGALFFSIYGTLHIAHHLLAATLYDPEWHLKIQEAYMPRGLVSEKLLIWLSAGLSYVSGCLLLFSRRRQVIASWRWLLGDVNGKFDWLLQHGTNFTPRSGGFAPTNHQQNIIHIQFLSASLLGLCLSAHLPAVMVLRFVFGGGNPINIYGAAHAMHDSNTPWIGRFIFKNYYAVLISSFFIHAVSSVARWFIKRKYKETSRVYNKTNTDDAPTTVNTVGEYARKWFVRAVVPTIIGAVLIGYVTVGGIASKTNEELCAPHFPIKH